MNNELNWTGERLETHILNETSIEHLHRYAIAMELAKGKKVLDIACGEGYGSNLMATVAENVTGMDIDKATIEKAKQKYKKDNIIFLDADAENIPVTSHTYDMVVSFETLEHVKNLSQMIRECKRVLRPGGLLIISTPDKNNYSDKTGYLNPFHTKELYLNELESVLKERFNVVKIYQQVATFVSLITCQEIQNLNRYTGNFSNIEKNIELEPLYFFALVSDEPLPSLSNSIFMGNTIIQQSLNEKVKMVTSTFTYRLGHFILYPFKKIFNLFSINRN